jgi:hypothetical protein
MTPNRLNRYISQMEAFRRKHENGLPPCIVPAGAMPPYFYQHDGPAGHYAWATLDPDKYGGSPQEDHH